MKNANPCSSGTERINTRAQESGPDSESGHPKTQAWSLARRVSEGFGARSRFGVGAVLSQNLLVLTLAALVALCALGLHESSAADDYQTYLQSLNREPGTNVFLAWVTNGPAVAASYRIPLPSGIFTNRLGQLQRRPVSKLTPTVEYRFDHYFPESLNNLIWTNFIAHTNGRSTLIWSVRQHPPDWPTNAPVVAWNTNCLMWGMRGLTALSPCWASEGYSGQVPITLLTRRHGYARGHSMGPDGFHTNFAGFKVWFVATNDTMVEVKVVREVVRTQGGGVNRDYTILLFDRDLPPSIQPIRVTNPADLRRKYKQESYAPSPMFFTEQTGNVSAEVAGFMAVIGKGGDSGSPIMVPMPGELLFWAGASTSGPSNEMQADIDELSRLQGLRPSRYQLQWVSLSRNPDY